MAIKDKEARAAYNRAYYERKKSEVTQTVKTYRESHRDEIRERNRRYRENNREKVREMSRRGGAKFRKNRPQHYSQLIKNWGKKNPQKIRAYWLVRDALKSGALVRPANCSKCGQAGKIHAHHADYSKPLDVVWLCPLCHKNLHASLN